MSAVDKTLAERGSRYGEFADNARVSQKLEQVFRDVMGLPAWHQRLEPIHREALKFIAQKISRILNGDPNYKDNWHDIAGYATLVERWIDTQELPELRKQGPGGSILDRVSAEGILRYGDNPGGTSGAGVLGDRSVPVGEVDAGTGLVTGGPGVNIAQGRNRTVGQSYGFQSGNYGDEDRNTA